MAREESLEYFHNGLQSKSFATFEEMRKNGEQVDVTIKCGSQLFTAHRLVLSNAVPYFRTVFGENVPKTRMQAITMKLMDPAALECLIDYAYTSRIKITESNVESVLLTAEYLRITEVTDTCCRFLSEHLSPNNVIRIQRIAKNIGYTNLAESANIYLGKHFDAMCRTREFLSAPFSFVHDLVRRDDLNSKRVYEAVRKWLKEDSTRTRHLPKLLAWIRVPLPSPYLMTKADKTIRPSVQHWNLVRDAKHSRLLPKTVVNMKSFASKHRAKALNLKHRPYISAWFKPLDSAGHNGRDNSKFTAMHAGLRQCCSTSHISKLKAFPAGSRKNAGRGEWNSSYNENKSLNGGSDDEETFDNAEDEFSDNWGSDEADDHSDTQASNHKKAFRYSQRWRTYGSSHRTPRRRNIRKYKQKINQYEQDLCSDDWDSLYDDSDT